ncbi:MAG: hypothetical protein AB7T59_04740 [Hyphomonadaceae bacterium]
MRKRDFILAAAALAACSQLEQKAEPPLAGAADDPAGVIRAVYAPYLAESDENLPELQERAPWSASLRPLVERAARFEPGESIDPDGLVFDPFLSAQEWGIENNDLTVTTESLVPESHAVVRARFNRDMEVVYDLIWENGGWRIDNMRSGGADDGWDLRRIVEREATR